MEKVHLQPKKLNEFQGEKNSRISTARHIIIKLLKDKNKEKVLKAAKERQFRIYKGFSITLTANFSSKTRQASKQPNDIINLLKETDGPPRLLHTETQPFQSEGETKTFSSKLKQRTLLTDLTYKNTEGIPSLKERTVE